MSPSCQRIARSRFPLRRRARQCKATAAGRSSSPPVVMGSACHVRLKRSNPALLDPGGVRIASRAVIGAGRWVTRDVPDAVFAAANPRRVICEITEWSNGAEPHRPSAGRFPALCRKHTYSITLMYRSKERSVKRTVGVARSLSFSITMRRSRSCGQDPTLCACG